MEELRREFKSHKNVFLTEIQRDNIFDIKLNSLLLLNERFYQNYYKISITELSKLDDKTYSHLMEVFIEKDNIPQKIFSNLYGCQESVFICLENSRMKDALELFEIKGKVDKNEKLKLTVSLTNNNFNEKKQNALKDVLGIIDHSVNDLNLPSQLITLFTKEIVQSVIYVQKGVLIEFLNKMKYPVEFPKRNFYISSIKNNKSLAESLHLFYFFAKDFPTECCIIFQIIAEANVFEKNYEETVFNYLMKTTELPSNTCENLFLQKIDPKILFIRGGRTIIKALLNSRKDSWLKNFVIQIFEGLEKEILTKSSSSKMIQALVDDGNFDNSDTYILQLLKYEFDMAPKKSPHKKAYETNKF